MDLTNPDTLELQSTWVLWTHKVKDRNWNLESYSQVMTITTVKELVQFVNSFGKLNVNNYQYFLMKEGIAPIWEDKSNRNGGVCTFKTEIIPTVLPKKISAVPVWNFLVQKIVGATLFKDMSDINGISFGPKHNNAIIKIWNKDSKNNLSKTLPEIIKSQLSDLSIKYKPNVPEY